MQRRMINVGAGVGEIGFAVEKNLNSFEPTVLAGQVEGGFFLVIS